MEKCRGGVDDIEVAQRGSGEHNVRFSRYINFIFNDPFSQYSTTDLNADTDEAP